ncbi:MAG: ferredoxin family protein [Emergencia sp.]
MSKKELFAVEVPCSARPIVYNEDLCIGCNKCAEACQSDILVPNVEKGKHPIVMYPGECIYCGGCVMDCPVDGAIKMQHPLINRSKFVPVKDKVGE